MRAPRERDTGPRATPSMALTPKEREVLELLARNLSNKEIALAMQVGEETIKWHLKNLFGKLAAGTASRSSAAPSFLACSSRRELRCKAPQHLVSDKHRRSPAKAMPKPSAMGGSDPPRRLICAAITPSLVAIGAVSGSGLQ